MKNRLKTFILSVTIMAVSLGIAASTIYGLANDDAQLRARDHLYSQAYSALHEQLIQLLSLLQKLDDLEEEHMHQKERLGVTDHRISSDGTLVWCKQNFWLHSRDLAGLSQKQHSSEMHAGWKDTAHIDNKEDIEMMLEWSSFLRDRWIPALKRELIRLRAGECPRLQWEL